MVYMATDSLGLKSRGVFVAERQFVTKINILVVFSIRLKTSHVTGPSYRDVVGPHKIHSFFIVNEGCQKLCQ